MIRNDAAVSPVVGVILVMIIAVILAGAIAVIVLQAPEPQLNLCHPMHPHPRIAVIVLQAPEPQPSQTQISTFELGVSDGKNGTYNPQPGRWVPDYKDGYKLGYTVAHCSCNCTGGTP